MALAVEWFALIVLEREVREEYEVNRPIADVLMVVEADIATTELVERVLLACDHLGVSFRKRYLHELSVHDFRAGTIPFFVRVGDPGALAWAQLLQDAEWPFIYYLDDNFWELEGQSPLALYYQDVGVRQTLECFVAGAQTVLTNSKILMRYLSKFSENIKFVPAFFDFSLLDSLPQVVTKERRIGFAGSTSRVEDLQLVAPAIDVVLARFNDVVFEFAGIMPVGIMPSERVRFFPPIPNYRDFIRFQASRGWQIGLAPLLSKESNRSKTNNKFREYGACGIAGIYSSIEPYAEIVHGETGLIAPEDPAAWTAAICGLLEQQDVIRHVGEGARAEVLAKYSVDGVSYQWAAQFLSLATDQERNIRRFGWYSHSRFLRAKAIGRLRLFKIQSMLAYREGGSRLVIQKTLRRLKRAWNLRQWY